MLVVMIAAMLVVASLELRKYFLGRRKISRIRESILDASLEPKDFLGYLATEVDHGGPIYLMPAWPAWLSDDEVFELFAYTSDPTACRCPVSMASSISGDSDTTIGRESQRLIYSYVSGRSYPHNSTAEIYHVDIETLKELFLKRLESRVYENINKGIESPRQLKPQ